MNSPCNGCHAAAVCQPMGREYRTDNGIFIKEMDIAEAGTIIPQHSHAYEHVSYVAQGAVLFDGREYVAPCAIRVPAHKKHTFQALQDDTLVLCIHAGTPIVVDEHQLVGGA